MVVALHEIRKPAAHAPCVEQLLGLGALRRRVLSQHLLLLFKLVVECLELLALALVEIWLHSADRAGHLGRALGREDVADVLA